MKTIKLMIKKWFFKTFIVRYLNNIDPKLLELLDRKLTTKTSCFGSDKSDKEFKRIMKILSSEKYKKFFYAVVNQGTNNPLSSKIIKPYDNNFFDKISKYLSKTYIKLFNKKLYNTLELYKSWRNKIINIDNQINEYLLNTTNLERVDRALEYGIIDETRNTAIKRLSKIKNKRVTLILSNNNE